MSALRRRLRPETIVPILSFTVVLVAYLLTPSYSSHELSDFDAYNTLQGFASLGLIALALGLTIIAGEFDVSVLGMQALGGVLAVKAGASWACSGSSRRPPDAPSSAPCRAGSSPASGSSRWPSRSAPTSPCSASPT